MGTDDGFGYVVWVWISDLAMVEKWFLSGKGEILYVGTAQSYYLCNCNCHARATFLPRFCHAIAPLQPRYTYPSAHNLKVYQKLPILPISCSTQLYHLPTIFPSHACNTLPPSNTHPHLHPRRPQSRSRLVHNRLSNVHHRPQNRLRLLSPPR